MDVDIFGRNHFENEMKLVKRNTEIVKVITMDEAIAKLEGLYDNIIIPKYEENQRSITENKNKLDFALETDNNILEAEDDLRANAKTMDKNEFMERFNAFERTLNRDRALVMAGRMEIDVAKNRIDWLTVFFANSVYDSYLKVSPNEKADMVLDVINRLSIGEVYQDKTRREFTESIIEEIALRMKKDKDLYRRINEIREQNMHYTGMLRQD